MSKNYLVMVGAGGHARSCIDVIRDLSSYDDIILVGNQTEIGARVDGYEVVSSDDDLPRLRRSYQEGFVGIGQVGISSSRANLYQRLIELDFSLPTLVSPRSYVSPRAEIGPGTIIMHGAVVNAGARIGKNCIVNTRAIVEHGSIVDDHCHISTGVILNGGVTVGARSFIGSGAVVMQEVKIGEQCVVGMGCSLRVNVVSGDRFLGEE